MPKIVIKNMSFEKALRIFRKKVEKSELKDDLRKKEYYENHLDFQKIKNFIISSTYPKTINHTPPKNKSCIFDKVMV